MDEHIFYDALSSRFFKSTYEKIEAAVHKLNKELNHKTGGHMLYNSFMSELGLPKVGNAPYQELGWICPNGECLQVRTLYSIFSDPTGEPCIAVNFDPEPVYYFGYLDIEALLAPINEKLISGEIDYYEARRQAEKALGIASPSFEQMENWLEEPKFVDFKG